MKTLIKKDLLSIRLQLILTVIVSILGYGFGFLIFLSDVEPTSGDLMDTFPIIAMFSILAFTSIFCYSPVIVNTIIEDKNCNFLKFYRTTPLADASYSVAKIVSTLLITGVYTVLGLIAFLLSNVFLHTDLVIGIIIPVTLGITSAGITVISIPVTMKSGKLANIVHITLMIISTVILALFVVIVMVYHLPLYTIVLCLAGLAVLALALIFVTYKISKKLESDIDTMVD